METEPDNIHVVLGFRITGKGVVGLSLDLSEKSYC